MLSTAGRNPFYQTSRLAVRGTIRSGFPGAVFRFGFRSGEGMLSLLAVANVNKVPWVDRQEAWAEAACRQIPKASRLRQCLRKSRYVRSSVDRKYLNLSI